jgi:DNA-binding MarR family transcriptional regulator
VLEEVNLGYGIADLVISKVEGIASGTVCELTYFDAVVYKIIESKGEISYDSLREVTKVGSGVLGRSLSKLISSGYIENVDSLIKFRRAYIGISTDSIAVEAKLKNWRRALNQAYRYKWFASKSYVVLDGSYIRPAIANIDEFRKMNVGLAEIDRSGALSMHYRPKKSTPIDRAMWIMLNEELKNYFLERKNDFHVSK